MSDGMIDISKLSSGHQDVILSLIDALARPEDQDALEPPTETWSVVIACMPDDANDALREPREWTLSPNGRWLTSFDGDNIGHTLDGLRVLEIKRVGL